MNCEHRGRRQDRRQTATNECFVRPNELKQQQQQQRLQQNTDAYIDFVCIYIPNNIK